MYKPMEVSYTPRVLRSLREICEACGVGEKVARRWAGYGAPIAREGEGRNVRYSAELAALQAWRAGYFARRERLEGTAA